jgi:hypothetical protein
MFHMHPSNLRALSDLCITRMARYVQVLGIQLPKFNALRPGLIDPVHDPIVQGNCVLKAPDGEIHYDSERPVKTLVELTQARMAADITTMAQALNRMPKLSEVRTGNFADEQLCGLRPPVQIPPQDTICCV